MKIHSNKITLRSFTLDDVEQFYELVHNDSAIEEYVPYAYVHNITETVENIEAYVEGDCINDFYLVIEVDGVMVGSIIAIRALPKTLDLSLIIFEKHRGQGIMNESLKIFIDWLKNNTDYKTLIYAVKNDNASSIKLAKKFNVSLSSRDNNGRVYKLHI